MIALFQTINEVLAAATVIIASSMLLYNITRDLRNRVARSSGSVLACVTFVYICEVFLSLDPDPAIGVSAVRLQWVGIAFIPAAMFHLSDALLATTGLPSRGRRRRIIRILYLISCVFLVAATTTDLVITPVVNALTYGMRAQVLFWLYVIFFIGANAVAFFNVNRARLRCLTRSTQRRMAYLQMALLTPALGIFPYSVLLGDEFGVQTLVLVNIANVIVISMLIFLSYPLSFFGSQQPDRVVKVELLRFLLRGPGTGMLALAVIIFTTRATRVLGLAGEDFMPFAVVAVVLLWQWFIAIALPYIEHFLIYNGEDDEQLTKLQDLSDRILTRQDLKQLIDGGLEACCDYLRTRNAFIALHTEDSIELVSQVGTLVFSDETIQEELQDAFSLLEDYDGNDIEAKRAFLAWRVYQITPLYRTRESNGLAGHDMRIGIIAFEIQEEQVAELPADEITILETYLRRIETTINDLVLQTEIFAALEGLLPQISTDRIRADEMEYRPGHSHRPLTSHPSKTEIYEQVRAALRHYWGGPGITRSRLLEMKIVQDHILEGATPVQALRSVLQDAIEHQRPEGERSMTNPEWTLYNILDLRFIERKKVADVARRMVMSSSDLYRKQRLAIEVVTDTILEMEAEKTSQAIP